MLDNLLMHGTSEYMLELYFFKSNYQAYLPSLIWDEERLLIDLIGNYYFTFFVQILSVRFEVIIMSCVNDNGRV